ncbi:MAG: hypothetical protein ACREM1_23775 [Longimicrobiales bacterium]
MANGEPPFIHEDGFPAVNLTSGYDPGDPYSSRDPRFDATVIHDGSAYRGDVFEMWESEDGNTWGFDRTSRAVTIPGRAMF